MESLLERALQQNFVPVTDDRDVFIGIVTRRDIIKYFADRKNEKFKAGENDTEFEENHAGVK